MGKKDEKWVGFCGVWPTEGCAPGKNCGLPVQQKDGILERIPSDVFDLIRNQALVAVVRRPFTKPRAVRAEPSSIRVLPASGTAPPFAAAHSSNPASAPVPIVVLESLSVP